MGYIRNTLFSTVFTCWCWWSLPESCRNHELRTEHKESIEALWYSFRFCIVVTCLIYSDLPSIFFLFIYYESLLWKYYAFSVSNNIIAYIEECGRYIFLLSRGILSTAGAYFCIRTTYWCVLQKGTDICSLELYNSSLYRKVKWSKFGFTVEYNMQCILSSLNKIWK